MTSRAVVRGALTGLAFLSVLAAGCGGDGGMKIPLANELGDVVVLPFRVLGGSRPDATDRRPVQSEPVGTGAAAPSVKDFLAVCDLMAHDVAMASAVQSAAQPLVVEIRPIENKTDAQIDLTIYPQTIRGIIMKSGSNRMVFRDETARRDILAERSHQSGEPATVDYESTTDTADAAPTKSAPATRSEANAAKLKVKKSSDVSSRIAEADCFLNGFIYAVSEKDAGKGGNYRYFRFQFRLTDARSGLVLWENDYEVKKQGATPKA